MEVYESLGYVYARNMKNSFKKAVQKMLVLQALRIQDMYPSQISDFLNDSNSILKFTEPYDTLGKLLDDGFVTRYNRKDDNNYTREYYKITFNGVFAHNILDKQYGHITQVVEDIRRKGA